MMPLESSITLLELRHNLERHSKGFIYDRKDSRPLEQAHLPITPDIHIITLGT